MTDVFAAARSLSVLLPVRNVQSSLAGSVNEILDTLGDLTENFELLILDEGSTDATCEVASELAQRYPQVRLMCERRQPEPIHPLPRAARVAKGDLIIAHDGRAPIDADEIVQLWRLDSRDLARSAAVASTKRKLDIVGNQQRPNLAGGRQEHAWTEPGSGGFHIIHSAVREPLRRLHDVAPPLQNVDSTKNAARRPNFLARIKNHVREFTVGQ